MQYTQAHNQKGPKKKKAALKAAPASDRKEAKITKRQNETYKKSQKKAKEWKKKQDSKDKNSKVGKFGKGTKDDCSSSFVPGTKVLMADGSSKPIEEIEVGDKILATDPHTGKTEAKPVTALIGSTGEKQLVQVSVTTDDGKSGKTGAILATDQHPFWIESGHHWADAAQLKMGMWLRTDTGTFAQVSAIETRLAHNQRVHNLTVAEVHTYYVLSGATPVLVHNSDCPTASKYEDVTEPKARMKNVRTNVGPTNFGKNLERNGWTRVERGPNIEYQKDGHGISRAPRLKASKGGRRTITGRDPRSPTSRSDQGRTDAQREFGHARSRQLP